VRNELFRWVELLARRADAELAERLPGRDWTPEAVADAVAPYRAEHDGIGIDADARAADLCQIGGTAGAGRSWTVRQVLVDPAGDHDWAIEGSVDLDASDEEGRAVVALTGIARLT
jgi:hypothetical protein